MNRNQTPRVRTLRALGIAGAVLCAILASPFLLAMLFASRERR